MPLRGAAKGQNDWNPDGGLTSAEIRAAMEEKSKEFRNHGGEIYLPKDAAE